MIFVVRKSYGKMRGTRKKLRAKRRLTVTKVLYEFKNGDKVHIDLSSVRTVHPKFHGLTGFVVSKRGKNYMVKVRNKKALKTIFVSSSQLKKI